MSRADDIRAGAALLRVEAASVRDRTARMATEAAITAAEQRDLARAERDALRDKLALIEVTVALWEAGADGIEGFLANSDGDFDRSSLRTRVSVLRAHAEVVRDILEGE